MFGLAYLVWLIWVGLFGLDTDTFHELTLFAVAAGPARVAGADAGRPAVPMAAAGRVPALRGRQLTLRPLPARLAVAGPAAVGAVAAAQHRAHPCTTQHQIHD
jgi:hypothetical protein